MLHRHGRTRLHEHAHASAVSWRHYSLHKALCQQAEVHAEASMHSAAYLARLDHVVAGSVGLQLEGDQAGRLGVGHLKVAAQRAPRLKVERQQVWEHICQRHAPVHLQGGSTMHNLSL